MKSQTNIKVLNKKPKRH